MRFISSSNVTKNHESSNDYTNREDCVGSSYLVNPQIRKTMTKKVFKIDANVKTESNPNFADSTRFIATAQNADGTFITLNLSQSEIAPLLNKKGNIEDGKTVVLEIVDSVKKK